MKKSLFINDGEILRIEDNKYYVLNQTEEYLIEITKEEFKNYLNNELNWIKNNWNEKLKKEYLEIMEEL